MTIKTRTGFIDGLGKEFQSKRLLPSLTAGVLMGITEIIFALSVGSLLFSGDLAAFLSYGLGIALLTATVTLIGISLGSSIPGVTGSLQDSSSVILAVIAAALVSILPANNMEATMTTVLVAIATTTLLTGAFFLVLGYFKLGRLVRFLPYPVVGGFLAGTGWLLVKGSFGVMAGVPLSLANIPTLLQSEQLALWVPGLLFALVLFFSLRRIRHFLVMPGVLIGVIALFYLGLLVASVSVTEAMDRGLLLGEVPGQVTWQPLAVKNLLAADWGAILGQGGNMAIILLVGVVGLLLNSSALELAFRQDMDLNRELRVAGLTNLLSGLGGGAIGFHALDLSALCCRTGARGRLPGLVAGAVCATMLFAGAPLLAFFPKPLLGGLLFFMGLGFLVEWVIEGWSKLSRSDYAVVLLILVVIGATNFLTGVGVGLVVTIVLFVVNYSRIKVVRHALSGAEIKSNVERCAYHRQVLSELGQHVFILKLHGFLFFGTANALLEQIRARVTDAEQPEVRYIILDFRRVVGLDSSAAISFVKCRQIAEARGITLLLTTMSERMRRQLELGGLFADEDVVRTFPDLDHGLEWCEDHLLQSELITHMLVPITLKAQLKESGFKQDHVDCLLKYLKKMEVEAGEYLIRQGDQARDLYFIERGDVSVHLELEDGKRMRLQTLGLGTIVGESGLYLGKTRTASVIADSTTVAYRLSQEALFEIREHEPELAAVFYEFLLRLVAERLAATNRTLAAMLR